MIRLGARAVARVLAPFVVVAFVSASIVTGPVRATPTLTRGFADDVWFDGTPASNAQWIARTRATGATRALIEVDWAAVEPRPPQAAGDPSIPSASQYDFTTLDARVREFVGSGISPVFLVTDAPSWAEAPGGPAMLEAAGAWQPNVVAFGQLARALATRYSGSYPDPLNPGRALPRVRYFQAWAEANLSIHLAPQWVESRRGLTASGPALYRSLLNAFYAGVKSVHSDNVVITSGFGPYGDPPSLSPTARTPPAQFVRDLLCLRGRVALTPGRCNAPAHFDVLGMDPYEVGSPTTPAVNADDVSAPDLGKLTRILNKAVRVGRALPRGHKQLWVTEFSYDSDPPNPTAVSLTTQARWLEEAFYVFWRQGVDAVFWYLVRDQAGDDYSTSYFSGVYFYNGSRKPSFEAYRFPFVVSGARHSATVWGISPRTGVVVVQHKNQGRWKALFRLTTRAGHVFQRMISATVRGDFRAVIDRQASLTWHR